MNDNNTACNNHETSITEIMTPDMANFGGNVHGGAILKLLDQAAYACAARYSGRYCVTLSLDHVLFKQAIKVGELVTFHACVNYTGRTSMEIGLHVVSENIRSGEQRHTNTCYVTMVAVDDQHSPVEVPPLKINTPIQAKRHADALLRKQLRQEYEHKHQQYKAINSKNNRLE